MWEMLGDVGVQRCHGIVGDIPETIAIAVNADRGALRHSGLSCLLWGFQKYGGEGGSRPIECVALYRLGWPCSHTEKPKSWQVPCLSPDLIDMF
jgi:hypothetical protein